MPTTDDIDPLDAVVARLHKLRRARAIASDGPNVIREASRLGMRPTVIAKESGMTYSGVRKIIRREEPAAAT